MSADRVFVIAEAGVNHNGSLDRALALVDSAAQTGADAVKFQTFRAEALAAAHAPKAAYQAANTGAAGAQLAMLKSLELDRAAHERLMTRAGQRGIEFLSTPFDDASLDLLVALGVKRLKIGSGEITNGPFLLRAARTGLPILLSTGMANLREVREALSVLAFGYTAPRKAPPSYKAFAKALAGQAGRRAIARRVTVLHCTTQYPAPVEDVNLRAMETLSTTFGVPAGYSDHTLGTAVAIAAAARGACVIEKHITLDRTLPGPDHKASLEPTEFAAMVVAIRDVGRALGRAEKRPATSERGNMRAARKSLVAMRRIGKGEVLTPENVGALRPGGGRSPMQYWSVLGRRARRNYEPQDPI